MPHFHSCPCGRFPIGSPTSLRCPRSFQRHIWFPLGASPPRRTFCHGRMAKPWAKNVRKKTVLQKG